MGNTHLTLDDLYDIVIKLDPDFLYIDKRVKEKADPDRLLLYEKGELLKYYPEFPDGVNLKSQRKVKSILKVYIENSRQTIDIGLDNYMLPELKKHPIFMEYYNGVHFVPHKGKPWSHLINLPPYQLLRDGAGRPLPDTPKNRIPTELLSTIYETYTGRKVNLPNMTSKVGIEADKPKYKKKLKKTV